jgi:hypothetical protein
MTTLAGIARLPAASSLPPRTPSHPAARTSLQTSSSSSCFPARDERSRVFRRQREGLGASCRPGDPCRLAAARSSSARGEQPSPLVSERGRPLDLSGPSDQRCRPWSRGHPSPPRHPRKFVKRPSPNSANSAIAPYVRRTSVAPGTRSPVRSEKAPKERPRRAGLEQFGSKSGRRSLYTRPPSSPQGVADHPHEGY